MVPAIAFEVPKIQKTQSEALRLLRIRQANQQVANLLIFYPPSA